MSSKTAIQGIAGSFHDQAAQQLLPNQEVELLECQNFRDVFDAVRTGRADYGIAAIENSLHGSINPVYRLLAEQDLWICGEARLRIELFLIAHKQRSIEEINNPDTEVLSQVMGLAQCEGWLDKNLPQASRVETNDTADSVRFVSHHQNNQYVAIAGRRAAELYDGKIIAGPINDDLENYTRFFLLTKDKLANPKANRTSLILTEASTDKAGTLVEALSIFNDLGINLSKLDSHPLPGEQRRYAFYIDFDEAAESPNGARAIQQLQKTGWTVQVLGSYLSD